jgi:hypothetical protein
VAEGEVARDAAGELHSGVASVVDVGKVDDPVAGAVNDAGRCSNQRMGTRSTRLVWQLSGRDQARVQLERNAVERGRGLW